MGSAMGVDATLDGPYWGHDLRVEALLRELRGLDPLRLEDDAELVGEDLCRNIRSLWSGYCVGGSRCCHGGSMTNITFRSNVQKLTFALAHVGERLGIEHLAELSEEKEVGEHTELLNEVACLCHAGIAGRKPLRVGVPLHNAVRCDDGKRFLRKWRVSSGLTSGHHADGDPGTRARGKKPAARQLVGEDGRGDERDEHDEGRRGRTFAKQTNL
jgi:hypothetical protein